MGFIIQKPTPPNEWLHNGKLDWTRQFTDVIARPERVPAWAECTTAEKEQWELEHPAPEPQADVVE